MGTSWMKGWCHAGRGVLTSCPPCQEDPLSLQPPVGTAGSLRPWALIQTVPTWSLWGARDIREKCRKLGEVSQRGEAGGRDPQSGGDAETGAGASQQAPCVPQRASTDP